jgi:hypothetical protein
MTSNNKKVCFGINQPTTEGALALLRGCETNTTFQGCVSRFRYQPVVSRQGRRPGVLPAEMEGMAARFAESGSLRAHGYPGDLSSATQIYSSLPRIFIAMRS